MILAESTPTKFKTYNIYNFDIVITVYTMYLMLKVVIVSNLGQRQKSA